MGSIRGAWRIHPKNVRMRLFFFKNEILPWLRIILDTANNLLSTEGQTTKLELTFPSTMSALKVKCHLLFIMEDETVLESTAESILSSNRTIIPMVLATGDEICDIIFTIKYGFVEEQQTLSPVSLGSLLSRDSEFTDVVLVSRDNCRFPVHRCALAAHSPVFRAMFASDMSEKQNGVVEMSDLDGEVLRRLLDFVYTNVVADDEMTPMLFVAADKYAIDALKARCEDVLAKRLSAENAVDFLVLADDHGGERLKGRAMDFIAKCGKQVIDSDEFRKLESTNPQLAMEMFRAIVRECS